MEFLAKWVLVFFIFLFLSPDRSNTEDNWAHNLIFILLSLFTVAAWGMD